MAFGRSIRALVVASLAITTSARIAPPRKVHQHQHEAIKLGKRQPVPPLAGPPPQVMASTPVPTGVLTYITPSPSATPVAVTKQSQIVTSFVPQFTLCELPPMEYLSITPIPVSANPSTAPYQNFSISIPSGNGTCTTIYSPTITMVCATILTGLVDKYTVSQCAQDLTFSTEYGYVLVTPTSTPLATSSSTSDHTSSFGISISSTSSVSIQNIVSIASSASTLRSSAASSSGSTMTSGTSHSSVSAPSSIATSSELLRRDVSDVPTTITPGPSIETLTTYYMAPWQDLTASTLPTDVDLKVCRTFAANDTTECIREYQVWSTSLVTMTTTSVTSINISTTIHGVSQVLVETFVANVTEQLTTFSMSTTMDLEFQTEWTTTHSSTRNASTSTGPTVYETMTVAYASSKPTAAASQDTTSTTTIHLTSTIYVGTSTVTIPMASAVMPSVPTASATPSTSIDFASMLGIRGQ